VGVFPESKSLDAERIADSGTVCSKSIEVEQLLTAGCVILQSRYCPQQRLRAIFRGVV